MATLIRSPVMSEKSRVVAVKGQAPVSQLEGIVEDLLTTDTVGSTDEQSHSVDSDAAMPGDVSNLHTPSHEPQSMDVEQLAVKYKNVLARAEAAEQRLSEIENKLDVCRLETKEAGYAAGYAIGEEAGREENIAKTKELEALIASMFESHHLIDAEQEENIVEIVYAAVLKIMGAMLTTREGVRAVVCEVIKQVSFRDKLLIHVSPSDFTLLSDCKEIMSYETDAASIDLVSDSRVQLGGCILESSGGSLDGRLEVQLQELKNALLAVREGHAKESGDVPL